MNWEMKLRKRFTYIKKYDEKDTIEDQYASESRQLEDGDLIGTTEDLVQFIKNEII